MSIWAKICGYDNIESNENQEEKFFNNFVIKSLLRVYLDEEGDLDKKIIAEFAQVNTSRNLALKEQYPFITNLCMEYVNGWDIEKLRKKVTELVNKKLISEQ